MPRGGTGSDTGETFQFSPPRPLDQISEEHLDGNQKLVQRTPGHAMARPCEAILMMVTQ